MQTWLSNAMFAASLGAMRNCTHASWDPRRLPCSVFSRVVFHRAVALEHMQRENTKSQSGDNKCTMSRGSLSIRGISSGKLRRLWAVLICRDRGRYHHDTVLTTIRVSFCEIEGCARTADSRRLACSVTTTSHRPCLPPAPHFELPPARETPGPGVHVCGPVGTVVGVRAEGVAGSVTLSRRTKRRAYSVRPTRAEARSRAVTARVVQTVPLSVPPPSSPPDR